MDFIPGTMVKKLKKLFNKDFKYWLVEQRMKYDSNRVLPDFLIIGAMKSGTSSLFHYLNQHPELKCSIKKEIEFFSKDEFYQKGENWYRSFFIRSSTQSSRKVLTYEACPHYLHHPQAAQRIYDLLPRIKLILLLRNPTDRAISQYFHYIRNGNEKRSPEVALKESENNVYKIRSRYADQLRVFLKYFSADQILMIKSEEFYQNPQDQLKKVYKYLGIDSSFENLDLKPRNIGNYNHRISQEIIHHLDQYFTDQKEKLKQLTGEKINWD